MIVECLSSAVFLFSQRFISPTGGFVRYFFLFLEVFLLFLVLPLL